MPNTCTAADALRFWLMRDLASVLVLLGVIAALALIGGAVSLAQRGRVSGRRPNGRA